MRRAGWARIQKQLIGVSAGSLVSRTVQAPNYPRSEQKKLGSWTWEGSWNDCPAPSQAKSPFCSISISCLLSAVVKLLWTESHTPLVNGLRGLKSSFFSRVQSCFSRFHVNTEMHLNSDDTKGQQANLAPSFSILLGIRLRNFLSKDTFLCFLIYSGNLLIVITVVYSKLNFVSLSTLNVLLTLDALIFF